MHLLPFVFLFTVAATSRVLARDDDLPRVVLPALAEAGTPDALTTELTRALHAALQARGWSSQGPSTPFPADDARCASDACVEEVLRADSPVIALRLRIFHLPQGHSVTLLAFKTPDGTYAADVDGAGSREDALGAALDALQVQLERGAGPWLALSAKPPDATARLDGRVLGMLPLTVRVTPGEHVLEILHSGYATYNTTLTIGELVGTMHEVRDVALKALSSGPMSATGGSRPKRRKARGLMGAGVPLAATGALAAAFGLRAVLREGDCHAACDTPRPSHYDPRLAKAGNVALTAIGAATFVAGITLTTLAARRYHALSVEAAAHGMVLLAKGRF